MTRAYQLIGQRFGRLLVVERVESDKHGQARWGCRCDCGRVVQTSSAHLKSGHTKSCGCLHAEVTRARSTTHGHSQRSGRSRTYNAWREMKRRCYNPKSKSYPAYGGSGVTVCARWKNSFQNFLADMGECPPGLELDRAHNSRGYAPGNCRWVNEITQSNNRRFVKRYRLWDEYKTLADWSRDTRCLVGYKTLRSRVREHGWSLKRAIITPSRIAPVGKSLYLE